MKTNTNKNAEDLFTPCEKKVVRIIKKLGGNRKMLAGIIGIKPRTFDSHVRNIHLKTHTHDYAQIVIFAYENSDAVRD